MDYRQVMILLICTFTPIILSQFVYQLSGTVDNAMFGLIMDGKGFSEGERLSLLGIYGGKYRLLTNVPVAIASLPWGFDDSKYCGVQGGGTSQRGAP